MNHNLGKIENNVLVGLDGNIFLFDGGQRSFSFSTGDERPSRNDVEAFIKNIEKRNCFLERKKIPFLHLVFPSKEVILRNKVPQPWQEKIQSLYLSYFCAQPGSKNITLYPIEMLKALNCTQPVFRVLDTHMTDAGTMAVTQQVLEKWGLQYDVTQFFVVNQEQRSGDLANMLKIKDSVSEDFFKPTFKLLTFDNRASLPGNTDNVCIVHNPESITHKRLLIFGDSFIKYALPFFSPIFRDIVYVRSATFQPDMVDLMAPDFVVSSSAERYLCKVDSDTQSKAMLFTHYGKKDYTPSAAFSEAYAAQFSYRYHQDTYEAWSRKMLARRLSWEGLGIYRTNQQVQLLEEGTFRSIGTDPYLIFPSTTISPDKCYILDLVLESDVDSTAAVYFQVEGDDRFSENKTIKQPVSLGENYLTFPLPRVRLNSVLRIDPLACQGNFDIKKIILRAVE